jgi:hypothetical protein
MGKKTKRRGPPKTTGAGLLVGVRCHAELLEKIDRWRAAQPPQLGQVGRLSRPQAIRWLAELGLKGGLGQQPAPPRPILG